MILAYCNLSEVPVIQLFDEQKKLRDSCKISAGLGGFPSRPDLLASIADILKKNSLSQSDVTHIYVVTGPGRFTPVRTACLLANTFARELGTKLCAVSMKDFQESGEDFQKIILRIPCKSTDFLEPIFNSAPSINVSQK